MSSEQRGGSGKALASPWPRRGPDWRARVEVKPGREQEGGQSMQGAGSSSRQF